MSNQKILLLGEAPAAEEIKTGVAFSGGAGRMLREQLLPSAGLSYEQFTVANVFHSQSPQGNVKLRTLSKTELKKAGLPILGAPIFRRHFLPEDYYEAMATLDWIKEQNFDFILALGGTALWLLTGDNRIGLFRGTIGTTSFGPQFLATYHPSAVLKEYKMLPIVWADLSKMQRHLSGTLAPPLNRTFIYSPTWEEIQEAYSYFLARPNEPLGVDIETAPAAAQITTISFATPEYAICIPLWDKAAPKGKHNVYETAADEAQAWRWIDAFAKLPNTKILQNGLYDMQYLLDAAPLDIRLAGRIEDTNILHHALEIELPKDLGTLASLYVNEPGWKQMRTKHQEEKAED